MDVEWHPATEQPEHGEPVIAEFYEWNDPRNPATQQVVWWWEGEWRLYPLTDGTAYVNRWRRLPAQHAAIDAAVAAERERLPMWFRDLIRGAADDFCAVTLSGEQVAEIAAAIRGGDHD